MGPRIYAAFVPKIFGWFFGEPKIYEEYIMNLKKNDTFARGNNNASVFKVGGAKVAVENYVIKAFLFAGKLKSGMAIFWLRHWNSSFRIL